MKKTLLFILICFLFMGLFRTVSYADVGQCYWKNPTKIITYIPPNHKYTAKMKRACAEWSRLTKNGIIFKYTSDADNAEIRVYFVKQLTKDTCDDNLAIGCTGYRHYSNGQFSKGVQVWLADYTQEGKKLSDDQVYTTMLHELGHAIGLDHTNNKDSIMYPDVRYVDRSEITKEELNILAKKYGWKK